MRCPKAKMMLALYVGGDLPEFKASRLMAHLQSCDECAAELKTLRQSRVATEKIGGSDIPKALPADFADQVIGIVSAGKSSSLRQVWFRSGFQRMRPVAILSAVVVIVLIAVGVTQMVKDNKIESVARWRMELIQSVGGNGTGVAWETIPNLNDVFETPVRMDQFDPPREAGVYAVMHRIEAEGEPPRYVIDYCGESRRLGPFRGHPWINQSKGRLLSRAGSEENVYIAVMLMPDSTPKDRRDIEAVLIEAFNPYFNRVKGA